MEMLSLIFPSTLSCNVEISQVALEFKRKMSINAKTGTIAGIIGLIFVLFMFVSWVKNVVHLTQLNFATPYKAELARGLTTLPFFFLAPFTAWQDVGEEDCDVPENKGNYQCPNS
jgi:hypothetical protein